jgi:hypothetical protein
MAAPTRTSVAIDPSTLSTTVKISWAALSSQESGGSPVTGYRIRRNNGYNTTIPEAPYTAIADPATVEHTFTGELLVGVTYKIVVAAVNYVHTNNAFALDKSDQLNYSHELVITVANAPAQVTGLWQPTTGYVNGQVKLEWEEPSTFRTVGAFVSRYTVLKDVGSGAFYPHAVVDGNTLDYTDSNLTAGQKYSYKVFASNIIGDGPESSVVIGTAGQEPGEVTTLSIVTESSTTLVFSWVAPSWEEGGLPVTGYLVRHDAGDFAYGAPAPVAAPPFSFAVPGGKVGETFRFRVAAQNELGTGVYSREIRLVATDRPGTPTLTHIESLRTLTGVTLRFRAGTSGGASIIGFHLYKDEGIAGSPFSLIYNGTSKPEILEHTVSGLQTALTYRYKLYAQNKIFLSAIPAELAILTGSLPDRPRLIRRVATTFTSGQMTIEWDEPSHVGGVKLLSYEVWVDDGAGDFSGISAPQETPAAADSQVALTGLVDGRVYGIKMRAVNEIGSSDYSDLVYLVCADRPATPAAPSPEASTRNSITVAWSAPADGGSPVTGYSLYMNALADGDWKLIYEGNGYPTRLIYIVGNLTPGQSYRFMIGAHNLVGSSLNSSEVVVVASDYPAAPS